jgi:hypothetical protein
LTGSDPKLEHSKESVFKVPDSLSPSMDKPPKSEALHAVVARLDSYAWPLGRGIESDSQKFHIILDYIKHHKTVSFTFFADLIDDFSSLPRIATLK